MSERPEAALGTAAGRAVPGAAAAVGRASDGISEQSTVREVLVAYPDAEAVFDRHGLLGCGGPNGPIEPIGFFARVHRVDPVALVSELNEFVAGERPASVPGSLEHGRDRYPWFMGASLLIALGAGLWLGLLALWQVTLGLQTGLAWDALIEAHGHLQVEAFVTLFVAGVAFHIVPRFRSRALAYRPLAIAALPLLAFGSLAHAIAQDGSRPLLMATATLAEAAGTLAVALPLLAVLDVRLLPRREPGSSPQRVREAWEPWLIAGLGWLLVAGALDAVIGLRLALLGASGTPDWLLDPWLHAALLGFAGSFVLGVGLRTLPVFMGLGAPVFAASDRARLLWTAGVGIGVVGPLVASVRLADAPAIEAAALLLASALELPAALVAAAAIGLGRRGDLSGEPGGLPRQYEWFVRAAFAWALVALALNLVLSAAAMLGGGVLSFTQVQAARHALALGFLTQMMLGFATRIVPVFRGRPLRLVPLVWIGFISLNAGVLLRVVPEFALGYSSETSAPMAASGAFAFTGILALAAALAATYLARPSNAADAANGAGDLRRAGPSALVSTLPVGLIVDAWPELLPVLLAEGFAPLANPISRRMLGSRISLETGARLQGHDPVALTKLLREALAPTAADPEPALDTPPAPLDPRRRLALMALSGVFDPELGLDIVSLGLVRDVAIADDAAEVRMTLTTPGCPAGPSIVADAEDALAMVPGIAHARIALEFEPAWSWNDMSPEARAALGIGA